MTPDALRRRLAARAPDTPWPDDPRDLLMAVERRAERAPGDAGWTRDLLDAQQLATAEVPLPAGLRREALIRADAFSATWTAIDAEGARWMVRAPRPSADAVHRRVLARDRVALAPLVVGLHLRDDALVAPAPGAPIAELPPTHTGGPRRLGSGLLALADWAAAGLGPGEPHPEELRAVDDALRLVALTPAPADPTTALRAIADATWLDGALGRFVDGLRELSAGAMPDLLDAFRDALADDLGERAVALRRRSVELARSRRHGRLLDAVRALEASVPPPPGRGGVGYDLDGRPTVVACEENIVRWGPLHDTGEIVWDASGFRAPIARRLLRACAAAPSSAALQREVGGSEPYADAIGRWVSAGLKLRTVRLLLEKA